MRPQQAENAGTVKSDITVKIADVGWDDILKELLLNHSKFCTSLLDDCVRFGFEVTLSQGHLSVL